MSLSKLDPSPTSGASSQASFDGQNPFPEKQHPLLLPTVLDTAFAYLNFKDLKSSRLVCKSWSEVGIPFIGRRKLKPVNIFNVSLEDFLALKQEFQDQSKPHPKLKLFQGFALTWEEVVTMSYCNFMPSFKPNQLVISGRNISDNLLTNLNLLQPLMTTVTHLDLGIILDSSYSSRSFIDLLNNLAQIQQMTLKILRLEISVNDFRWSRWERPQYHFTRKHLNAFYRSFEVVFQSQSPTLEELELEFECLVSNPQYIGDEEIKEITFPVFPSLHHLTLALDIKETPSEDYLTIFAPFDFCVKFPQLVQLDILDWTLNTMDDDETIVLTREHPLMKKLNVHGGTVDRFNLEVDEIDFFKNLHLSFPFIEELRIDDTPLLNLNLGGIEISWVETLRVLECFTPHKDFNFGHLKKLEYLHCTFNSKVNFEAEDFPIPSYIEMLLEHHRQLPHLTRFRLTYACDRIPPEKKSQILEGLPEEFRAILTLH